MQKLSVYNLPWHTDWADVFGADRPIITEIGFGYGHFLLHLARSNPQANVIGLEVTSKCLNKVERLLDREQLTNARLIYATAESALYHLFAPGQVSQFHINFPDPWFKSRHAPRRLMKPQTVDALVNRLVPGGVLYLATDILDYAEMTAELLAAAPGLENTQRTPFSTSFSGRVTTKYEAKALRAGRTCYYFAYQRNHLPPPPLPLTGELDMPHLVLQLPMPQDDINARFSAFQESREDIHIRYVSVYGNKRALLFEVYIREPTIDQHLALLLTPHTEAGAYTLKPGAIGQPRMTYGVHLATGILGDWLLSLHPEARVLADKVRRSRKAAETDDES